MDFKSMKRKELQALCKKNGLPANSANAQMIESLSSVLQVKLKGCLKGFGGSSGEVLGVSRGGPKKVSFVVEDGNEEDSENFARKPSAKSKRKSFVKGSSVSPGLRRSSKETSTGSAAEVPQRITRSRRLSSAVLWSPIIEKKKNKILKDSTEGVRYNVEQSLVKKMDSFEEVPTARTLRSRVVVASGDEELATDRRTQNRKGSVENEDNEKVVALPEKKNLLKRPRDGSVIEDKPPRKSLGRTQGKLKETVNTEEVDGPRSRKRRKGDLGVGFVDKVVDQEIERPAGPGRLSKRLRGISTASKSDNVVEMEPTRRSTRSSSIIKEIDTSLLVSKKSVKEGELVTKAKSQKQAENGALDGKKQEDEISVNVEAGQKGKLRRQAKNRGSKRGESTLCTSKLLMDEATLPTIQKLRGDSEAERRVKPIKQPKKRPLECADTSVSLLDDGAEAESTKRATRSASKLLGNEASPVVGKLGNEINDRNKKVKSGKHATYSASKQGALTADSEAVSTPARRLTHSSPKLLGDVSSIPVIGKLIVDTVGKDKSVTRVQTSTSKSRDSASVKKEDSTTLTRRPTRSSLQLEDGTSSAPKLGSLVNEAVSTPKRRATRSSAQQLEDVFSESVVERFGGGTDTVRKNKSGKQATRSALKGKNSSTIFSANKAEITTDRRSTRSSLKLSEEETSHALEQGDLPPLLSDNKAEAIPARRSMRSSSKMSEDVTGSALFPNSEAVTAPTRRSTTSSLKMSEDVSSTPVVGKLGGGTVRRDKLVTQVKTRASTVVLVKNEDSTTQTRRSTRTSLQLEDGTSSSPKLPSLLPDNKSVSTSISRATYSSVQQLEDVSSASVVRRLDSVSDTDRNNKSGKQATKNALKGGDSITLFSANKSAITPARRSTRSSLKLLEGTSHASEEGDLPALLSDSKAEILPARRSICSSSKLSEDVPYTSVVGNFVASENADSADPLLDNSLVESENLIDDSEAIRKDKSGEQSNNHALEQGGSSASLNCPSMQHLMEDEITPLLHVDLGDGNVEGQKNLSDRSERESDPGNNAMKDSGPGSEVEVSLEVEYDRITHLDGMTSHSEQYRSEAIRKDKSGEQSNNHALEQGGSAASLNCPVMQHLMEDEITPLLHVELGDGNVEGQKNLSDRSERESDPENNAMKDSGPGSEEQYRSEALLPVGQNLGYETEVRYDGVTLFDGMTSHSEQYQTESLLPGGQNLVYDEAKVQYDGATQPDGMRIHSELNLGKDLLPADQIFGDEAEVIKATAQIEEVDEEPSLTLEVEAANEDVMTHGEVQQLSVSPAAEDALAINATEDCPLIYLEESNTEGVIHHVSQDGLLGNEAPGVGSLPLARKSSDLSLVHDTEVSPQIGPEHPDPKVEFDGQYEDLMTSDNEVLREAPYNVVVGEPDSEVEVRDVSSMEKSGAINCDELLVHGEYSGELSPTLINEASPLDQEVDIRDSSKMTSLGGSSITAGEDSSKLHCDELPLHGEYSGELSPTLINEASPVNQEDFDLEVDIHDSSKMASQGGSSITAGEESGKGVEVPTVLANDAGNLSSLRRIFDSDMEGCKADSDAPLSAQLASEECSVLKESEETLGGNTCLYSSEAGGEKASETYTSTTLSVTVNDDTEINGNRIDRERNGDEVRPSISVLSPANQMNEPEVQLSEESLHLEDAKDIHGSEMHHAVESGEYEKPTGPCSPTGSPAVGLVEHGKESLPDLRLHEVQLCEESLDLEVPIDVHGSEEHNAVESGGDEEATGPCSPTGTLAVALQDHGKQSLPVAAVDSHFGAEQSDTTQMSKGRDEDSVDAEENSSDSFGDKLFKEKKGLFLSTAGFTVVDRALNVQPMESVTKFAGISCEITEGKSSIDSGDTIQLQDSSTPTKLMDNEGSVDSVYMEFRAPSALTVDNAVLSESEVRVDEARKASHPSVSCAEESLSMSGTESCAMLGFEGSTIQDIVQDMEGMRYLSEQHRDTVNVVGSLNSDSLDKSLKSEPKVLWSLGNKQPNVVSDDLAEATNTADAFNHSDSERHFEQVELVGEEMENMDPSEGETSGGNDDDTSMKIGYSIVSDEIDHISEVAQKPSQHFLLHETEDCSGETHASAILCATENAEGNDERAAAEEETGGGEESEPVSLFPLAKVQKGQESSSTVANETSFGQGLGLAEGPGADHTDISDFSLTDDKEAEKKVELMLPCNRDVDLKEEGSFTASEEANDKCSAEIFLLKTDSFSEAIEHASLSDSGRKTNIIHDDIFSCKEVREDKICTVGGRDLVNRDEEGNDSLSEPVSEDTYHADIDNDLKLAKNSDCSHSAFPSTEATKSERCEDHSAHTPVEDTRESGIKESNEIIKESLVADQPLTDRQELFGSTVEDLPETATTEQAVSLVQFDQKLGDDAIGCRGPSETGLNFKIFEESAEIQNEDGIDCSSSKDHTQQSNLYQVKFEKYEQAPAVQESWVAPGAMEWSVEELFHMDTDMEAQVGQWECRVHEDYGRTDSGNYGELSNAETSLTGKEDMKAMAANLSGESPEACSYSCEMSLKADTLSYTSFENYLSMTYPAADLTSPGKSLGQVTDDVNKSEGNEPEGEPRTKDERYLENISDEEK